MAKMTAFTGPRFSQQFLTGIVVILFILAAILSVYVWNMRIINKHLLCLERPIYISAKWIWSSEGCMMVLENGE